MELLHAALQGAADHLPKGQRQDPCRPGEDQPLMLLWKDYGLLIYLCKGDCAKAMFPDNGPRLALIERLKDEQAKIGSMVNKRGA
jgi:hypothetical protein